MPDEALSERLVHLMNNCVNLDENSMVQLLATAETDMFTRLLDVLSEIGIRDGGIARQPKEMWDRKRNVSIQPNSETAAKAKKLKASIPAGKPGLLFRFSSYRHMEELVSKGGLLFQQASTFREQENISVRDDELKLTFDRYASLEEVETIPFLAGRSPAGPEVTRLSFCLESPDFLTLCLTNSVNYRMISDWAAEAAVIIHDPAEFRIRLARGTELLRAGTPLEEGKVHYIDPYFPLTSSDVPFCKHIKFAYQREFRFVVRMPRIDTYDDRKIFLGPLSDIATLVDLR